MRVFNPIPPRFSKVAKLTVKCAEQVFDSLGPGLLDTAYRSCLAIEMGRQGIAFQQNVPVSIVYADVVVSEAMRLHFIVDEAVVVMVYAVEEIRAIHEAQMRTYLQFSELRIGLILNFDVVAMKQGVKKVTV